MATGFALTVIMFILALDTALTACSVAILDADADAVVAGDSLFMDRGHAEALVPMVEQVLADARMGIADMDRIAVTVGPGSFTGLRVGLSAARAFALAGGRPAVGVTTLAALAAPYLALDDSTPVLAAIDARHGHVFLQLFGAGGRTLVSPRIAAVKDAARAAAIGAVRLVGSGAGLVAEAWPPGEVTPSLVESVAVPDVAWVARLGAAADPATAEPRPLYLRSPDAKPQDAARIARR